MNSDRDDVRSLQQHYTRLGRKSRVITWDRHEMRRQLKVFHIQSTFSMLHIGRWPFRYEPNHYGRSSTAGHVFRNVSFCNGMCYILYFEMLFLLSFRHFESTANFWTCQTADAVFRWPKNSDRSENFLRLHVVPIPSWPGLRFSFRSIYRNESSRSELSFCTGLM